MPQLSPLDDPAMYKQLAEAAYNRAGAGVVNPGAVLQARMADAGQGPAVPGLNAPQGGPQPGNQAAFMKPFSPQERAMQRQMLIQKLKELDAQDAQQPGAQPMPPSMPNLPMSQ